MGAGRPPDGPHHVDRLTGDEEAKHRLRVILEAIAGAISIEEACEELRVSASRFHELRHEALQAAVDGLTPHASGRPRRPEPEADPDRLAELTKQNEELKAELLASSVRTEIALVMPHLLTKEARVEIKKKARVARKRLVRSTRSDGSGT